MYDDPIRIVREETISDNYFPLKNLTYQQRYRDGSWHEETREIYDNASGAAILLHNANKHTVLLVRQFRPAIPARGIAAVKPVRPVDQPASVNARYNARARRATGPASSW